MSDILTQINEVLLVLLCVAMVPAFVRVVLGPSLPDRVIALDLMAAAGVAVSALYASLHDQPVFLDVAIVLALISFVGTVAFAFYLQRTREGTK